MFSHAKIVYFETLRKIKFYRFNPVFGKSTRFSNMNMHGLATFVGIKEKHKANIAKNLWHIPYLNTTKVLKNCNKVVNYSKRAMLTVL